MGSINRFRPPRSGWWFESTHVVLGNRCLRYLYTQFQQFTVNAECAPTYIGGLHFSNERSGRFGNL